MGNRGNVAYTQRVIFRLLKEPNLDQRKSQGFSLELGNESHGLWKITKVWKSLPLWWSKAVVDPDL